MVVVGLQAQVGLVVDLPEVEVGEVEADSLEEAVVLVEAEAAEVGSISTSRHQNTFGVFGSRNLGFKVYLP